jgi:hypothetical protein
MSKPRSSLDDLNRLLRLQVDREAEHRDWLRVAVETTSVPLAGDLVERLLYISEEHFRDIMQGHPGFDLSEKRTSYEVSFSILKQTVSDLQNAINDFARQALADESALFTRQQAHTLEGIERRIQKELFAVTNAAASLVDHSRRVRKLLDLPEHDVQLQRCFGADGLHEFVVALRVLLHHLHMVEAGWNLTRGKTESTATFGLNRKLLLRVIDRRRKNINKPDLVAQFVTAQSANIDLKKIFGEYWARVQAFHVWFAEQIAAESLVSLRDYDQIIREKKNHSVRLWWNMLLGNWLRNWKVPPNPYNHLHKYLTEQQLAEVLALPRKSREQVDRIIAFVDEDNAISNELRLLAYELFERAPDEGDGVRSGGGRRA